MPGVKPVETIKSTTTNSTHLRRRHWDSNQDYISGRPLLSFVCHSYSLRVNIPIMFKVDRLKIILVAKI